MKLLVNILFVLVTLSVIKADPVENEGDIEEASAKAIPSTVIHASNLPTDGELQLLVAIQQVHGIYLTNPQTAGALSRAFTYRAYYCAWNVIIFPAPHIIPPTDEMGNIWNGVPKSGYALVLVTDVEPGATRAMYYYVFSSPQQSRRCEF